MADVVDEILENLFSAWSVGYLGVELQAVELALRVLDGGERGTGGGCGDAKTTRQIGHLVTVAVPDIDLRAQTVEEERAIRHIERARAIFAPAGESDCPAEMMSHQHEAVTNSEHWNSEGKNLRIDLRRA